mmetsp:Transcript_26611/g.40617  ORF Transcript_26611/g.40617 Transcript_26611/m.40617 type:complete len:80 (+) Transcript_26611:806-1045(+)
MDDFMIQDNSPTYSVRYPDFKNKKKFGTLSDNSACSSESSDDDFLNEGTDREALTIERMERFFDENYECFEVGTNNNFY